MANFKAQLEADPKLQLTDKQKNLIKREDKYEKDKDNFLKNRSEDEL